MKIESKISQLIDVDYPLIQSCETCIAPPKAIAMIANAGALPFLCVTAEDTPTTVSKKIEEIKGLTTRPFGVNLALSNLANLLNAGEYIRVISEGGVKLVETDLRILSKFKALLNSEGLQVFCKCYSLSDAQVAQNYGSAAVMMMGIETCEGAKKNSISSLLLIPQVVGKLDIPVIACGGFESGKGLVAAFSLGAQAVVMERCLLACSEAQNIISDIVIQACKVVNHQLAPLK